MEYVKNLNLAEYHSNLPVKFNIAKDNQYQKCLSLDIFMKPYGIYCSILNSNDNINNLKVFKSLKHKYFSKLGQVS